MWLRPADHVILAVAIAMVLGLGWLQWHPGAEADWLEVRTPSGVTMIDLSVDGVTEVGGRLGVSIITIQSGGAHFSGAPCRNRVCIATGRLTKVDDFAACIPNGVTMRLRSATGYDSINY